MELDKMTWVSIHPSIEARLRRLLRSWEGTPYKAMQCAKQGAVDCVRFTCSLFDELDGVTSRDHVKLPPDQALHSKETAVAAMKEIRRAYMPNVPVTDWTLEPGDQLTMGYIDGGPGHSMIAGPDRQLWHTDGVCVTPTGLVTPPGMELVRVYRALNKEDRWLR